MTEKNASPKSCRPVVTGLPWLASSQLRHCQTNLCRRQNIARQVLDEQGQVPQPNGHLHFKQAKTAVALAADHGDWLAGRALRLRGVCSRGELSGSQVRSALGRNHTEHQGDDFEESDRQV